MENTQILHRLQSSLTRASLSGLSSTSTELSPPHRVLICRTYVLPQLRQFWTDTRTELVDYRASIGGMRLRLSELQESDKESRRIRAGGLKDGYEEVDGVLHHQGLLFVPEIIQAELISRHHDDPLAGHFGTDTPMEGLLDGFRNRSTDFNRLEGFESVIIDRLTKMVHYEPVEVTIDAPGLAEVILDVVVRHHGLLDSIVTDRGSLFTSKFRSSLCYFLGVKWRLSTAAILRQTVTPLLSELRFTVYASKKNFEPRSPLSALDPRQAAWA